MKSTMKVSLDIKWIDSSREPVCEPDPDFPTGRDVDVSMGIKRACYSALPYPAKRCGYYVVRCNKCGYVAIVTTAGRPDDPRSIRLPCKESA
jgi:hypothetical protein